MQIQPLLQKANVAESVISMKEYNGRKYAHFGGLVSEIWNK
ncbi:MAG TPA: hypothetical protein VNS32_15505 [Flavisolibacter sp.]|nr:hypothetical protein [Flavisolibacter sp.]